MRKPLTAEQTQYLKERGFMIINNKPADSEPFPYLTLEEQFNRIYESQITYRFGHTGAMITSGVTHPSTMGKDELVGILEEMVGSCLPLDGKRFSTQQGNPIKVFVIDPAWNDVEAALAAKYKS
jgi:hypothetical protein